MKIKNRHGFNDYFEYALYALALVCFIYFLINGNKTKTLQPILIIIVLLLIKAFKIEFYTILRSSILAFVFVAMFLAKEFDFYSLIPELDSIEHFFSGIILTFIGEVIFKHINRKEGYLKINPSTITFFSLFFSIAMAGCWEIYEFITDSIFALRSQNGSLSDTMIDIICGTLGAILGCLYLHFKFRKKTSKQL